MAEITIFQDEAFGVDALLTVINDDHVLPGQIAAAGLFDLSAILEGVTQTAVSARAETKGRRKEDAKKTPKTTVEIPPVWVMPQGAPVALRSKMWLDYQNDVKVSDVQLAAREGYQSVEHTKRYTTLGMAS